MPQQMFFNRAGISQPREGHEFPWGWFLFLVFFGIDLIVGTIYGIIAHSPLVGFWYTVLAAATEWTIVFTGLSAIIFLAFSFRTHLWHHIGRFLLNWKWSTLVHWWSWEVATPLRRHKFNDVPQAVTILVCGGVILVQIGHFFITGHQIFGWKEINDTINWLCGAAVFFTSLWLIVIERKG